MKRIILTAAVAAAALYGVFAQAKPAAAPTQSPSAVIEFVDGTDLSVVRKGMALSFDDPVGLALVEGDQVQTGKGTFVEVVISPRKDVLKISENTTFVIRKLSPSGETDFQLLYGRIRAKVAKLAGSEQFVVRGTNAVAGVRGTDFGYDIIAPRTTQAAEPLSRVYCFEGSVNVTTYIQPASAKPGESLEPIPQNYVVSAGEMISVEKKDNKLDAAKSSINAEIEKFWRDQDLRMERQPLAEISAIPAATSAPPPVPTLDLSEYAIIRETMTRKNSTILVGAAIGLAGVTLQGVGAYLYTNGEAGFGFNMVVSGAMISALSIPVIIYAVSIEPPLHYPDAGATAGGASPLAP